MNIAAYCHVSTDKADQLNSLEAQKRFFQEYAARSGHQLVRLYADEGISGIKIKKRKEFQRESITDVRQMTNAQLRQIVRRIEVDHDGNVDIHLRLLGDLGLKDTVLVCDNRTYGSNSLEQFIWWVM